MTASRLTFRPALLALACAASLPAFPALAASPACEAKRAEIEASIAEAQARGQAQRVRGLQQALAANQANCSDASLAAEREDDIREAQREVAEREAELAEEKREGGDADKIARRQAKLDEARAELVAAQKRPKP